MDLMAGKWKESQRVMELLQGRFVVFDRHSANNNEELVRKIQNTPGAQLLRIDSLTNVSSSQVRQCSDESQLAKMVTPSVLEYMKENKLYQSKIIR